MEREFDCVKRRRIFQSFKRFYSTSNVLIDRKIDPKTLGKDTCVGARKGQQWKCVDTI
jgi:hypothetical protein